MYTHEKSYIPATAGIFLAMSAKYCTYIGNLFIGISLVGTAAIYWPVVYAYLFPVRTPLPPDTTFSIDIPSIGALAPIVPSVNPWNKDEYLSALSHGVAHAASTALPGEEGTMYLFAHSSDAPWRITRYNTIFLHLGKLKPGDPIYISYEGTKYTYRVIRSEVVWPNNIAPLVEAQAQNPRQTNKLLIVQTCTPIGTDIQRLLVYATLD